MNKKVVVLGGGTGMSTLLRGLKKFPLDITAVVSVCDDGKSTGRLRQEFNVVAVGDLRRVLIALSETEPLVEKLLNYRFETTSDLDGHTVGNLLLTAASNISGNISDGIESLSHVLNLKGKVLPLTEDNVVLMGEMDNREIIEGEHNLTSSSEKIIRVFYKEKPIVNPLVLKAIKDADAIILSMGSLYTSILPNLICKEIINELDNSNAPIMYICNMMTQPGETDNYKLSDHINLLNNYLGNKKINIVLANDGKIDFETVKKYESLEQKDPVIIDDIDGNIKLITDDYVIIEDETIRHNIIKLAVTIFTQLI